MPLDGRSLDALELHAPRTRREVELVADLYGKAFGNYHHLHTRYLEKLFREVPREHWRLSPTLWTADGTPVAHVRVCDRTMRLGAVLLRVGGIGDVCTHPALRHRGLMRRLFPRVVDLMAAERYDLSILWGIGSFYDKFGFITALADGTLQLPRHQVARIRGPHRGRRATPADARAVQRLFEADLALRDGRMERPGGRWLRRALRDKATRVLVDPRGRLRACYQAGPQGDALLLSEVSLGPKPDASTVHSLVADMVRVARKLEKPDLRFVLPPDHPLGQFCVADGCEIRRYISHRGGAMARVVDLEALCAHMAPEWERLLAASPVAAWAGRLRLATDLGAIDLVIRRGRVAPEPPSGRAAARIAAGQDKFTRLLLGFQRPEAALRFGEVRISAAARPLADALFPPRSVVIFPADRF